MNYINNLISQACVNAIAQIVPDENSTLGKILRKTAEVGKGVVYGVAPYAINMSTWYLSRMTNMRILSVGSFIHNALDTLLRPSANGLKGATNGVLSAAHIIGVFDLFGYTPLETECRIAVDSLFILATVIGSVRAIYEGARRIFSSASGAETTTTSKVADFVSGALLTTLGVAGIRNSFRVGIQLAEGVKIFPTLDPAQKKGGLKHRAIHHLGGEKACKAVIITDLVNFKNALGGPMPGSTLGEHMYEHCDTRTYEAKNSGQFCEVLREAKSSLGGSIDVLSLNGHANNKILALSERYGFTANAQEISCMENALSSDAQVFLLGCNTATPLDNGGQTLTEKVSVGLPGRWVTGFSSYYNSFTTTTSFSEEGRILHDNHLPYNLKGPTGFSTAVTHRSLETSMWTNFCNIISKVFSFYSAK